MPTVRFKDDDLEMDVEFGASLKETAEEVGSNIPFGCEQGVCGTCLINVVEGEDNMSDIEEHEKETLNAMGAEPNQRLACQCKIEGDVTVESAH
ncbi:MAG: 2Fe-2S iron-sulfur cluster-binding protein [Candidatus Kerfeldbacteria bacterium]